MNWGNTFELIHYWIPTLASLGTLLVAISASLVYRKNSRLERARWASELYRDFYQKSELKTVRSKLDCAAENDEVTEFVRNEDESFTDYLNFFEYVAFLQKSKQLKTDEVQALFGYYIGCLSRHESVHNYISDPNHGYEGLKQLIGK